MQVDAASESGEGRSWVRGPDSQDKGEEGTESWAAENPQREGCVARPLAGRGVRGGRGTCRLSGALGPRGVYLFRVGMICRTRAAGRGLADSSAQGLGLAPVSGSRSYLHLLRSFLPSLRPGDRGQWWRRGRGLSVVGGGGGGEGGWARCYSLSLPPGNPVFGQRPEEERLAEKPEAEGQGPRGAEKEGAAAPGSREGRGLKACPLDPQRRRGCKSRTLDPAFHPSSISHSFFQQTGILSSPAGARHCARLLGLKKAEMEMKEAVSDTDLRVHPPLEPDSHCLLGCLSKQFSLLRASVSPFMVSPRITTRPVLSEHLL